MEEILFEKNLYIENMECFENNENTCVAKSQNQLYEFIITSNGNIQIVITNIY